MKCPRCNFGNPEGIKFCGGCGAKLERICPKCNSSNPPEFSFCGECGHDLSLPSEPPPRDLSLDEKLAKIQRYLPKGVTEKILAQRDRIEGERKNQEAGTLSGGEQQMLAIGRSIMSRPKLLMMDEPSMGLSPLVKTDLIRSIRDIWKSGITVLLVEQDASLTLELTQRVYILEHGMAGLEGESQQLMNNEEVKQVYFQLG